MYVLECYKQYVGRKIIIAKDRKVCIDKIPLGWIIDDKIKYDCLVIDKNKSNIEYTTTCEYMK